MLGLKQRVSELEGKGSVVVLESSYDPESLCCRVLSGSSYM